MFSFGSLGAVSSEKITPTSTSSSQEAHLGTHKVAVSRAQQPSSLRNFFGDFWAAALRGLHMENQQVIQIPAPHPSELDKKQAALEKKDSFPAWVHEAVKNSSTRERVKTWQLYVLKTFSADEPNNQKVQSLRKEYGFIGLTNKNGNCYLNASLQFVAHVVSIFQKKGTPDEQQRVAESLTRFPCLGKLVHGSLNTEQECQELHQEATELMVQDFTYSLLASTLLSKKDEKLQVADRDQEGGYGEELIPCLLTALNTPPLFFNEWQSVGTEGATYAHFFDLTKVCIVCPQGQQIQGLAVGDHLNGLISAYNYTLDDMHPSALVVRRGVSLSLDPKTILTPIKVKTKTGIDDLYELTAFHCAQNDHEFVLVKRDGAWHEVSDHSISVPLPAEWADDLAAYCAEHAQFIVYEKVVEATWSDEMNRKKEAGILKTATSFSPPNPTIAALNDVIEAAVGIMQFHDDYFPHAFFLDENTNVLHRATVSKAISDYVDCSFVEGEMAHLLKKHQLLLDQDPKVVAEEQAAKAICEAAKANDTTYDLAIAKLQEAAALWSAEIKMDQVHLEEITANSEADSQLQQFWKKSLEIAELREAICTYEILRIQGIKVMYQAHATHAKLSKSREEKEMFSLYQQAMKEDRQAIQAWSVVLERAQKLKQQAPERFRAFWKLQEEHALYQHQYLSSRIFMIKAEEAEHDAYCMLQPLERETSSEVLEAAFKEIDLAAQQWSERIEFLHKAQQEAVAQLSTRWNLPIKLTTRKKEAAEAMKAALLAWKQFLIVPANDASQLLTSAIAAAKEAEESWQKVVELREQSRVPQVRDEMMAAFWKAKVQQLEKSI